MKKIYFCLPAILTSVLQLSAQDIITKCNGEEIEAKVAEIGDTQIKYRKYENAQGPLYTLPASEVFLIRFEDGTREVVRRWTPRQSPRPLLRKRPKRRAAQQLQRLRMKIMHKSTGA